MSSPEFGVIKPTQADLVPFEEGLKPQSDPNTIRTISDGLRGQSFVAPEAKTDVTSPRYYDSLWVAMGGQGQPPEPRELGGDK
jgi:hypothetical protein